MQFQGSCFQQTLRRQPCRGVSLCPVRVATRSGLKSFQILAMCQHCQLWPEQAKNGRLQKLARLCRNWQRGPSAASSAPMQAPVCPELSHTAWCLHILFGNVSACHIHQVMTIKSLAYDGATSTTSLSLQVGC